jgi:hypothetical protein
MSYPADKNTSPMLRKLSQIGRLADKLNERAQAIIDEIAPTIIGQQVIRYGRRYQINQKPRVHGGHLECYGVPVNAKTGKPGVRGYSLGRLEECEFVKPREAKIVSADRWRVIRVLANQLIGTTGGADLEDEIEALTLPETKVLDTMTFRCAGCEWWHPTVEQREIDSRFYCRECASEDQS